MPRLALIAAAAVTAALGLASAASAATGPVPSSAPASASLSAMQTGTINPNTSLLTAGAPVPLAVSKLEPAPNSANLVIAPPQASEKSGIEAAEERYESAKDAFARALEIIREMQATQDRVLRQMTG